MMFRASVIEKAEAQKGQVSAPFNLPSPTNNINARDNFTAMDPKDAINLINAFPEANSVDIRRGFTSASLGVDGAVQTLLVWRSTLDKMFGAAGSKILDVSVSPAVAVLTGFSNAKWQWTNLENAGGQFLVAVNGADHCQEFDGTTWTVPTITGVDDRTLINVTQFKERLWFIQDNTLDLWYLETQAIQGAASKFPLGAVFKRGGYLIGLGSFSRDAGEGPDDYFCIATNNGEIAVYQGTDPTSATTWSLVGIFTVGKPIGRRCMSNLGGDLIIVTQDGVVSMQAALQYGRDAGAKAMVTSKIQTLFSEQSRAYFTNWGWQPIVYPRSRYFIVNVPQVQDTTMIQLVMNTVTGSWCRFSNMNAECWGVANDLLYFGATNGIVYQADVGYLDETTGTLTFINESGGILHFQNAMGEDIFFTVVSQGPIEWEVQTSWQALWGKSNKMFTAVRPEMLTGGNVQFAIDVDVDFVIQTSVGSLTTDPIVGMVWPWTWPGTWGGQNVFDAKWHSVGKFGTWSSVHLKGIVSGAPCQLESFDIVGQRGGVLG